MARIIVTRPKHLPAGNQVAIQREQFGRIILLFFDFLSQQVFWLVATQVVDPRTYEAVAPAQINHQDQVRKAFQKVALELFLTAQRFLHLPALSYIDERALIADDLAVCIPDCAGSIEKNPQPAVLTMQHDFPRAYASLVIRYPPEHWSLVGIGIQSSGIERKKFFLAFVSQNLHQGGVAVE